MELPFFPRTKDPSTTAQCLMQRTYNQDGLPEIAVGFTFLVISGLNYALSAQPRGSSGFKTAVIALAVVMPLIALSTPAILRWVRGRYLMARVGYVAHKPIRLQQIGFGITLSVLMVSTLFVVETRLSRPDDGCWREPGYSGVRWQLCAADFRGSSSVAY